MPCNLALGLVPVPADLAGGMPCWGRRWRPGALSLPSQGPELRFESASLLLFLSEPAEQVRFVSFRKPGTLPNHIGPQTPANAKRRQQPEPRSPGDLQRASPEDLPDRHRLKAR